MKKILLIGDSIRMGYDRYVRESMAAVAEVYYPAENCKYTTNILRDLHGWTDALGLFEADAVHWNAGLWDTLRIYGDGPLVQPEVYADNIRRISERIERLFPDAKQIFATSTPVIERGYIPGFEVRYNADVERYNGLAVKALEGRGVVINDLYALLDGQPESLHSDQSHYYTLEGTRLIGGQVNKVLCGVLEIDPALLTPPDLNDFPLRTAPWDTEMYVKQGNIYREKRFTGAEQKG